MVKICFFNVFQTEKLKKEEKAKIDENLKKTFLELFCPSLERRTLNCVVDSYFFYFFKYSGYSGFFPLYHRYAVVCPRDMAKTNNSEI